MSEVTHFQGTMIRVRMIGGQARRGDNGKNSYELALQEGYTGTSDLRKPENFKNYE